MSLDSLIDKDAPAQAPEGLASLARDGLDKLLCQWQEVRPAVESDQAKTTAASSNSLALASLLHPQQTPGRMAIEAAALALAGMALIVFRGGRQAKVVAETLSHDEKLLAAPLDRSQTELQIAALSSLTKRSGSPRPAAEISNQLSVSDTLAAKDILAAARESSSAETIPIPQYDFNNARERRPTWIERRRDSALTNFYLDHRRSVVRVLSSDGSSAAFGSGIFIDSEGTIATNFHVVGGAEQLAIETADRRRFSVRPVARDVDADLALLRVVRQEAEARFAAVRLATSSALKPGSLLTAIGHPDGVEEAVIAFGQHKGTIAQILPASHSSHGKERLVATSVSNIAIKSGSSGGGIFAEDGTVVSIARADNEGRAGFAAPVEHLQSLINETQKRQPIDTWLDVETSFDFDTGTVHVTKVDEITDLRLKEHWQNGGMRHSAAGFLGNFTGDASVLAFLTN